MSSSAAENSDKKLEVKERISIWLPTELWVDALKLLSKRQLLQSAQLACRRLHAIAESPLVPSIHVIRHFDRFLNGLKKNSPEAIDQLRELASSKADLARHFRLGAKVKFGINKRHHTQRAELIENRRHAQLCVLRHSLELFRGCQLFLYFIDGMWRGPLPLLEEDTNDLLPYLSLLAPARPFSFQIATEGCGPHPDVLLREPIFNNEGAECRDHFPMASPFANCSAWKGGKCGTKFDKNANICCEPRSLRFPHQKKQKTYTEIFELCKQSLQQAKSSSDRRSFLLILQRYIEIIAPPFKLENRASGEVLQLEPIVDTFDPPLIGLRRYPAAELANADKFYRDTFLANKFQFREPLMDNGLEAPFLRLG